MIKERFYDGDVVDLIPYESVVEDYGIGPYAWTSFVQKNPHVIRRAHLSDNGAFSYYVFEDDALRLCWPPAGVVLHKRQVIVEVGDLL